MRRMHRYIFLAALFLIAILLWPYLRVGPAPVLSWYFPEGQSLVYRTTYDVYGRANPKAMTSSASNSNSWQKIQGHFDATLDVTQIADNVETQKLALDFREVSSEIIMDGELQATPAANTLLVTLSKRGFEKLLFSSTQSFETRAQVRSLLSLWQVVLPAKAVWSWNAEEDSPQGRFHTQYTIHRVSSRKIIIKKNFVEKNITAEKRPNASRQGSITIVLDRKLARVSEIKGQIVTKIHVGQRLQGEEEATFSLNFIGIKNSNIDWAGDILARNSFLATLLGHEEFDILEKEQLRQRLGLETVETLQATILAHTAEWSIHEMNPTYLKLVALLKLYPEKSGDFVNMLLSLDPKGVGFGTISTALSTAGTLDAQAALQQATQHSLMEEQRAMALLPHLSMTAKPTPATEAFLRALSQSEKNLIGDTATLGLGSIAHHLKENEPKRARDLLDTLAQRLSQAQTKETVHLVLSAVGNIGLSEQIPLLTPFLNSTDADLRARAVSAFRHVDGPTAQNILIERGSNDSNLAVRARAVSSLSFRPGNEKTLEFYREILAKEREISLLKEALKNLSLMIWTIPESASVLDHFISQCGNSDLVAYAIGLLKSTLG